LAHEEKKLDYGAEQNRTFPEQGEKIQGANYMEHAITEHFGHRELYLDATTMAMTG